MRMLRRTDTRFTTQLLRCQKLMPDPYSLFQLNDKERLQIQPVKASP